MNPPNSIIDAPKMNPTKDLADGISWPALAIGQTNGTVTSEGKVPVLEWAETEAYAVAIQKAACGSSPAFRLSF